MEKFEILEHKADIKIMFFGKTKEEVFKNSLLGIKIILNPKFNNKRVLRQIKIKSIDLSALLIDFLNEIIFMSQKNKEFYNSFEIKKLSDDYIEGILEGKKIERFNEDIKAATYHKSSFVSKNDIWEAVVIFDI